MRKHSWPTIDDDNRSASDLFVDNRGIGHQLDVCVQTFELNDVHATGDGIIVKVRRIGNGAEGSDTPAKSCSYNGKRVHCQCRLITDGRVCTLNLK